MDRESSLLYEIIRLVVPKSFRPQVGSIESREIARGEGGHRNSPCSHAHHTKRVSISVCMRYWVATRYSSSMHPLDTLCFFSFPLAFQKSCISASSFSSSSFRSRPSIQRLFHLIYVPGLNKHFTITKVIIFSYDLFSWILASRSLNALIFSLVHKWTIHALWKSCFYNFSFSDLFSPKNKAKNVAYNTFIPLFKLSFSDGRIIVNGDYTAFWTYILYYKQ